MPKPIKPPSSPSLIVEGMIDGRSVKLRWKPIPRARSYLIQWLGKDREWKVLDDLSRDDAKPDDRGFINYVDSCPGPMGPGGTYRVGAYFGTSCAGKCVLSAPVMLTASKPQRSTLDELSKRLARKPWSADVKALISRLKWGQHGWTTLLPKEAGQCLGKRIEVEISSPALTDEILDLLAAIFENLPKLAARAEKAFDDYGGHGALDEDDKLRPPRIVIDDVPPLGKRGGTWTMLVEVKDSDYGWHIEFNRTRFRTIWSGD